MKENNNKPNRDYKITIRLTESEFNSLQQYVNKIYIKPSISKFIRLLIQPYLKENK